MKEWLVSIPVTTLLLYIFASILFLVLLAYLGYLGWRSWKRLDELKLKDRFAARNEFIKTTAQILGGAFFLITIFFTYQNLLVSEKNLAETQEKNKADLYIAREKQTTELYVKAVEQLGSDKLEVRLGGIYALERIARQSPEDHWPIMEVLTAYVRENAPWQPEEHSIAMKKRPWAKSRERWRIKPEGETGGSTRTLSLPDPDIQAILTVIGRRARKYGQGEDQQLNLWLTHLVDADLHQAKLQGAKLNGANFTGADFTEADLTGADLTGADLRWAVLSKTNLKRAKLSFAHLNKADFDDANLQDADLRYVYELQTAGLGGADLRGANLEGADIQGGFLYRANLQGAILKDVNFQYTDLRKANLRGSDLRGTKGLNPEQVAESYWDETTRWPEGFTPPAPRREEKQEGE